ncbi:MAG: radical SAM protein [Desulfobacterota bacterium]|nr:radical SAM protein [Thermodesulfobacteriota bacterium]
MYTPGFVYLWRKRALQRIADKLFSLFSPCRLCPWHCMAERLRGARGRCTAGATVRIAKAIAHYGEEPVISGTRGSGTIFFSHCNLSCCFCQNYQISHEGLGTDISVSKLADMMITLQEQGCHNINLVSPTHYLPFIVAALESAAARGLYLPIVYNSNGYEESAVLQLLDGIIDVYLPDMKYADDTTAARLSGARSYTEINRAAIDEMVRQTGYLNVDDEGIACRGTIIRHLVLPADLSGTERILRTIRNRYGRFAPVSLMAQYRPCYAAERFPELSRRLSPEEYDRAVAVLESLNFEYGWTQDYEMLDDRFVPDFTKKDTWN